MYTGAASLTYDEASGLYDRAPVHDDTAKGSDDAERQRRAWMAAAQAGDRRSYERVLADSVALIGNVARRRGVPADVIDDVVQETLITVDRVRQTYDPSRSYDAWLVAIASRRAIDALRSRGRHSRHEVHDEYAIDRHPDRDDASSASERHQQAQHLHAAIATLPPRQREAVEQLGIRERSAMEAAVETGSTAGALKVNLHRALKSLRERLSGES